MGEQTYNGWTNYETWVVNLHITNDEGLYRQQGGMIAQVVAGAGGRDEAVYALTGQIKDWVEDELLPALDGLAGDLLGAAVSEVDWREIAENWLSDTEDGAFGAGDA